MNDFLSGLGGLIKGMQPLMGEEVKKDASMNAFILKTEVGELNTKKREALARIGEAVYEAHKSAGKYSEFSELYGEVEDIDKLLQRKKEEAQQAEREAEEKKRAQERERAARVCPNCGMENEPGVKFCGECGTKLGVAAAYCPSCGSENAPGTKFCGECGAKL
ncbi:MAG: zinc ribbon domain-containing protein [Burkholderiales bacterium]